MHAFSLGTYIPLAVHVCLSISQRVSLASYTSEFLYTCQRGDLKVSCSRLILNRWLKELRSEIHHIMSLKWYISLLVYFYYKFCYISIKTESYRAGTAYTGTRNVHGVWSHLAHLLIRFYQWWQSCQSYLYRVRNPKIALHTPTQISHKVARPTLLGYQ